MPTACSRGLFSLKYHRVNRIRAPYFRNCSRGLLPRAIRLRSQASIDVLVLSMAAFLKGAVLDKRPTCNTPGVGDAARC